MAPEDRRPKQTAFRLPQRTLDILDKIVEEGKARTRTDALILVVDSYEDMEPTLDEIQKEILVHNKEMEEMRDLVASMDKKISSIKEKIRTKLKDEDI